MKTTYSWRAKNYLPPNRKLIKKLIEAAAELAGLELASDHVITITFVADRTMAALNWECLRHEGTTDVITFAYLEDGELLPGDTAVELIICADFAWREGNERRDSSYARELALYIAHGLLHASGEDDLEPTARRRMRRREREVMGKLSLDFNFDEIFPGLR